MAKPTKVGDRVRNGSVVGTVFWIGPVRRTRGVTFRKVGVEWDKPHPYPKDRTFHFRTDLTLDA